MSEIRRQRGPAVWIAVVGCIVLAASACGNDDKTTPGPSETGPKPSAATAASTEPTGVPLPGRSPGTAVGQDVDLDAAVTAGPPTSLDLIAAAVAAGRIDRWTGLLYRLYAAAGDSRLPVEYTGEPADDHEAFGIAVVEYADAPADVQASMLPYVVRPTDPASVWATTGTASAGAAPRAMLAVARPHAPPQAANPAAPACANGWSRVQVSPNIPVVVWGQCGGAPDASVQQRVDEIRGYMASLWLPMTNYMTKPIGDHNDPAASIPGAPEGNDGLLDIYFVDRSAPHARNLSKGGAYTARTTPYGPGPGATSSAYIVLDSSMASDPLELESTVAHEFFHAMQFAKNSLGISYEAAPGIARNHWFTEASASWSEHHFVPAAERQELDPRIARHMATPKGLADLSAGNAYDSWMWPLFMEQEGGDAIIARTWDAFRGKDGFAAVQRALDTMEGFAGHFHEFAIRLWNERLEPGDPIKPKFNDPNLDPTFPDDQPDPTRLKGRLTLVPDAPGARPRIVLQRIAPLSSSYVDFTIDPTVKDLTFDFSEMTPADLFDADALVKVRDKGWQLRALDDGKNRWCLDEPEDAIERIIVVLSDHDPEAKREVKISWTVQARAACGDLAGTITIDRTLAASYSEPHLPKTTDSETLHAKIHVIMKADQDPNGGGGLIDDRSSFEIDRETLTTRENGDCVAKFGTASGGRYKFKDTTIAGYENSITAFVDRNLGVVLLQVTVHYPYTISANDCGGGFQMDGIHDTYSCSKTFGIGIQGLLIDQQAGPDQVQIDCEIEGPPPNTTGTYELRKEKIVVKGTLSLIQTQP